MDCTTANGRLSAGSFLIIDQRVEGQNLQYLKKGTANAESTTLSFWVKSNKTGTYIAELFDEDNARQISKSYTINLADTWEKKTLTYAGDTSGTLDNDNGASLVFTFWLGTGTQFSSGTLATSWEAQTNANRAVGQVNLADSTSNYINITGVQLEAGTTASDFEFLPYDVNLNRCFRYYIDYGSGNGDRLQAYQYNSSFKGIDFKFLNEMRASPTLTKTESGGTFTVFDISNKAFFAYISSGTADGTQYLMNNVKLDAEL